MPNYRATVVIPVKDEDHDLLEGLVQEGTSLGYEVIVVDNGSANPYPKARFWVSKAGYGQAIKVGTSHASCPIVVVMDGDGQHTLKDVRRLVEFLMDFPEVDMVVGDRRLRETSWLRWLGRKGLNMLASFFTGRWIPDLNSGLRGFRRDVAMSYQSILCDYFSYTTSLTLSMLCDRYIVDWLPVRVLPRIHGKSQVKLVSDGLRTLHYIVWIGLGLRTRGIRGLLRRLHLTTWIQPLVGLLKPR